MDFSTYSDANLRDLVEKGETLPASCVARAKRLGLQATHLSQRAAQIVGDRTTTLGNLTPQEAAAQLGNPWNAKRLRKHLRRGLVPGNQISGRWYIEQSWVDDQIKTKKETIRYEHEESYFDR